MLHKKTVSKDVLNAPDIEVMGAAGVAQQRAETRDNSPVTGTDVAVGKWLHAHKNFTKDVPSYLGYQFTRAALASVPYGFGMAGVHHAMGYLNVKGQQWGYKPEELAKAAKMGGLGEFAKVTEKYGKTGLKAVFGRNMARVASSPLTAALQIGVAFTMFRTVGDTVAAVRDKLTNPNNTEAQTIQAVHEAPRHALSTLSHTFPVQAVSVPVAALALGFMNSVHKPTTPYQKLPIKGGGRLENYGEMAKRVWGPKSHLLQNMALWTLSYSVFFELADRLAKDYQVRNGTWTGFPNSTSKVPDHITGHPPGYSAVDVEGQNGPVAIRHNHKPEHVEHRAWFSDVTEDPSLGRMMFRRILPVALGISAYAFMKRGGYALAGGQMKPITESVVNSGAAANTKTFLTNAWREGAATSTFFVLYAMVDAWAKNFDHMFGIEAKADPVIQKNHQALLDKLNEKEHHKEGHHHLHLLHHH